MEDCASTGVWGRVFMFNKAEFFHPGAFGMSGEAFSGFGWISHADLGRQLSSSQFLLHAAVVDVGVKEWPDRMAPIW